MQVVSSWLNNPRAMSFDNISSDASLCGYQCPVQHARFDLGTSIDVFGWAIGELNYWNIDFALLILLATEIEINRDGVKTAAIADA